MTTDLLKALATEQGFDTWASEHGEVLANLATWLDERAEENRDRLVELAEDVVKWSEAYPVAVFGEPTPEQVDEVCKTLGFRIDTISAMVLRGFTRAWGDKARKALASIKGE